MKLDKRWTICKNGHTVNEYIIETDGTCHVCRGEPANPPTSMLINLAVGDALYFTKEHQHNVSGKASSLGNRHWRKFETSFGVVERVQ